jgi:hypothetical protein
MLYQAGNVAGIGVSFLTGMRAVTWAKAITGPQKWVAGTLVGLDVYGAGKATNNLYQSYQQNGAFEREDAGLCAVIGCCWGGEEVLCGE